jgi:hypothetical protein
VREEGEGKRKGTREKSGELTCILGPGPTLHKMLFVRTNIGFWPIPEAFFLDPIASQLVFRFFLSLFIFKFFYYYFLATKNSAPNNPLHAGERGAPRGG